MKITIPDFGQAKARPVATQFQNFNRDDGTDTLQRGLGQLEQGVENLQAVNAERAQKAKEKADAAAHDSLYAQAQDFTTKQLHGYDEAPESKPEGSTSIDTLTVHDLETAGDPGKHVDGYLDSRGNEAYEKSSGVTTALKKRYDELLALAGNDTQREQLGKSIDRLKASVQSQIAQHEGGQLRVAQIAASSALQDTTLRTAANLFDKPDELKPFVDDALASMKRTVLPEEYEAKSTAFLANVSKARIGKYVAAGNLAGAEQQLVLDGKVLGDDAPKIQELLTAKKIGAEKRATELSAEAIASRTADKARNPYGFLEPGDENKLRDAVDGVYPEKQEEMRAVVERRINAEAERRKTTIDSWTKEAKSLRLDGGTAAIYPELRDKLKKYNPDYLQSVQDDDRRRWEHNEAKRTSKAAGAAADKEQAKRNKLALTRMQALPYARQAAYEEERGFEGLGLDDQGKADLAKQQQLARNFNEKGFDKAKEALDNDIERVATDKRMKGEDPGTQFELRGDAAAELELFLQKNNRAPDAGERAKILSDVAIKQQTKPRVLESIRGKGMEFPFQQKKREGAPATEQRKDKSGVLREKRADGKWYPVGS